MLPQKFAKWKENYKDCQKRSGRGQEQLEHVYFIYLYIFTWPKPLCGKKNPVSSQFQDIIYRVPIIRGCTMTKDSQ